MHIPPLIVLYSELNSLSDPIKKQGWYKSKEGGRGLSVVHWGIAFNIFRDLQIFNRKLQVKIF